MIQIGDLIPTIPLSLAEIVLETSPEVLRQINIYLKKYQTVVFRHLTTEFEIQLRGGKITDESWNSLSSLEDDFSIAQLDTCLKEIINPWVSLLSGQPLRPCELLAVKEIYENVYSSFVLILCGLQDKSLY